MLVGVEYQLHIKMYTNYIPYSVYSTQGIGFPIPYYSCQQENYELSFFRDISKTIEI